MYRVKELREMKMTKMKTARTVDQIKSEIAMLEKLLKIAEKPKTKKQVAEEKAMSRAEWACNPASEAYWCM
jgi:hypothetical protein